MTPSMVEALEKIQTLEHALEPADSQDDASATVDVATGDQSSQSEKLQSQIKQNGGEKDGRGPTSNEPSLRNPKVGNPISHGQAIDLSKQLKVQDITPNSLDTLLRGARVYIAPPPPKPEPVRPLSLHATKTRLTGPTEPRIQSPHGAPPTRRRRTLLRPHDQPPSTHGILPPSIPSLISSPRIRFKPLPYCTQRPIRRKGRGGICRYR